MRSVSDVKVYSTPECKPCQMAKDYLREIGVDFTEIDISASPLKRMQLVKMTGVMSLPVVEYGGRWLDSAGGSLMSCWQSAPPQ